MLMFRTVFGIIIKCKDMKTPAERTKRLGIFELSMVNL